MLLLAPVLLLLLAPVVMMGVRMWRSGFAYQWLIAVICLAITWPFVLWLRVHLPIEAALPGWKPEMLFPVSPEVLLDSVSWPFAFGVVTLALAVILTAVARMAVVDWRPWAGTMILAGLSFLAVVAGNPLTLLLNWAAIDLGDIFILMVQVKESASREKGVMALAARISGLGFLVWGMMVARAEGVSISFAEIPAAVSPYLLLAAGLRLGVIPLRMPLLESVRLRRGLGTSLRLLPAASSLVLLVRAASTEMPPAVASVFLLFTLIAAVYSSLSWLMASDELNGRPFWILGIGAFAVTAAVRGEPQATAAWGLVLLLAGGFIFLLFPRHPRLLPLVLVGLLSVSALPFTPAWAGLAMYTSGGTGWQAIMRWLGNLLLFVSHVFILLGYLKHVLMLKNDQVEFERWAWLVYPLGLALPGVTLLGLGWSMRPSLEDLSWIDWLMGLLTLALVVGLWAWNERGPRLQLVERSLMRQTGWSTTFWAGLLSLSWFYRVAWVLYRAIGRLLSWFTLVLEGDGGLIWAFVLLGLLWALFLG